jgi:hypothetical protein
VSSVVCAARVATQRCGKRVSALVNQHATIEEEVFSVGAAPRLYTEDLTQLELELSRVSGVCSWRNNEEEMERKELGCAKKISCVMCSYSETAMNPLPGNN